VLGTPTDRDRPAAQRLVVALLDRGVKGVHIDVDDPSLDHGISDFRFKI
jgi:hypothetical protein